MAGYDKLGIIPAKSGDLATMCMCGKNIATHIQ